MGWNIVRAINGVRHFIMRLCLKNDDFTILSPTCVGGVIYHQLHKEFKSPTINLWLTEDDFFEFVSHLKWYINHDVDFFKWDEQYYFPIGIIRGEHGESIKIFFNHHKDFNTAKKDWDRRKQRINYSNIFVIASSRGIEMENKDKIKRWRDIRQKVKGLVFFTVDNYSDIEYTLQLKYYKGKPCVGSYMTEGRSKVLKLLPWEQDFNYVRWINTGRVK